MRPGGTGDEKLTPKRRLLIGGLVVALAGIGFTAGRIMLRPAGRVTQPVQFDHRKHVHDVGLECTACHEYCKTGQHSGLPALDTCLSCHDKPLTGSAEEQKLIALAGTRNAPPFKKLFRLPDHVYYSHRRHVGVAHLECRTCHGDIADTVSPPSSPLVRIRMDTCIACHVKSGVATDCTSCHR